MTTNIFSTAEPWSLVSKGYEATTMAVLAQYAVAALQGVALSRQSRVADIACGPGTVSRLLHSRVAHIDALDFSPEMIAILKDYLQQHQVKNVSVTEGDGQALPFKTDDYDLAISMFGLMFFPDRIQGFRELHRILKTGGTAVVSSWVPVEESPMMALMFGAMRAAKPDLPQADTTIENLEKKVVFEKEMAEAGFHDISVTRVTQSLTTSSVDDFWDRMTLGSAPIVMLRKRVGETEWPHLVARAKAYIAEKIPVFPATLSADAWIGRGRKLL